MTLDIVDNNVELTYLQLKMAQYNELYSFIKNSNHKRKVHEDRKREKK